ncbi:hypothetical protein [Streptomyces luteireticuli]|uniref:hypothetical protein n=1 Tax=Streptomyces luteireticuli TaxID=173858 RepID=UPI003558D5EE
MRLVPFPRLVARCGKCRDLAEETVVAAFHRLTLRVEYLRVKLADHLVHGHGLTPIPVRAADISVPEPPNVLITLDGEVYPTG